MDLLRNSAVGLHGRSDVRCQHRWTQETDRVFLKAGGVFTDDVIDAYIALKMQEVTKVRMSTHPLEFELYYSV